MDLLAWQWINLTVAIERQFTGFSVLNGDIVLRLWLTLVFACTGKVEKLLYLSPLFYMWQAVWSETMMTTEWLHEQQRIHGRDLRDKKAHISSNATFFQLPPDKNKSGGNGVLSSGAAVSLCLFNYYHLLTERMSTGHGLSIRIKTNSSRIRHTFVVYLVFFTSL